MADEINYGSVKFCDTADTATAGCNWLLCIYTIEGAEMLAVAGQQGLSISRSADSIEVTSKTTADNSKSYISGSKDWSIDTDGSFIKGATSTKLLEQLYTSGDLVCLKVIDKKNGVELYAGLACITDYSLEASYDDAVTFSLTLQGNGALVDLTVDTDMADGKVTPDGE